MKKYAIIGGSGLDRLEALAVTTRRHVVTPYGAPSGPLCEGQFAGAPVVFLARHGEAHRLPPHLVNYRANIAALKAAGVTAVFAVTAVGGIANDSGPGRLVLPDQIVDYTWGREHTFADGTPNDVQHVDFTAPFSAELRALLLEVAPDAGVELVDGGVYGATQGPRLETAAEIARMKRDGCTLVGMTGMPEAALAREAGLDYAMISLVVNWAAGIGGKTISHAEIGHHLEHGMSAVLRLVGRALGVALSR
ncbi:MAG: S-methyl-5'-thioinosine phosphorylase [Gammaproteobacteria bacterium]